VAFNVFVTTQSYNPASAGVAPEGREKLADVAPAIVEPLNLHAYDSVPFAVVSRTKVTDAPTATVLDAG
jgi:hypothetical protein